MHVSLDKDADTANAVQLDFDMFILVSVTHCRQVSPARVKLLVSYRDNISRCAHWRAFVTGFALPSARMTSLGRLFASLSPLGDSIQEL